MHSVLFRTVSMILIAVLSGHIAYAQNATSTSFQVQYAEFGTVGGVSTSSSFQSVMSGDQIPHGQSTSSTFALNAGPLYFETFEPRSQNWRWYDDENNETPSTALAGENVAPSSVATDEIVKLRIAVADVQGIGAQTAKFRLQYSTSSDFSAGAYFASESWSCSDGSVWCYADGGGSDDGVITTGLLTDTASCVASVGAGCGTHNESGTSTSSFTHASSTVVEYEFTIQESGAVANTAYFFRLVNTNASSTVSTNTGESYPSLTTEGATLTFTVAGIASSTPTEGVVTDVDTTATAIDFARVPYNAEVEAAQRLTVTTNAGSGYRIFVMQRQEFLSVDGALDPVLGTNPTPLSWTDGCPPAANSCYGYHPGEDILAGGSTRFAASDTYAQFSDVPFEVAYASGPSQDRDTDIIFKLEARPGEDSGDFESTILYIIVPVF